MLGKSEFFNTILPAEIHGADDLSLAYAELYLTLGTVLTRYNFELFETSMQDVDPMEDGFVAMPRTGSKGVRVTVH